MATMSNYSPAFDRAGANNVPVCHVFSSHGWRLLVLQKTLLTVYRPIIYVQVWFFLWCAIRLLARMASLLDLGDGSFMASWRLKSRLVRLSFAVLPASADTLTERNKWRVFWSQYYTFSSGESGSQNYLQAWRDKHPVASFVMFVNNRHQLEVPCSTTMNDKEFLEHMKDFYNLIRADRGILEVLGVMALARIEVVQLERDSAVGKYQYTLRLGYRGASNRLTYFFKKPSGLHGDEIMTRLTGAPRPGPSAGIEDGGVVTAPTAQKYALNLVRTLDPYAMSAVILLPMLLSLAFGIAWSVVAVRHYGVDVSTGVQTAFTVAGYIVTAGALLIALIVFVDDHVTRRTSNRD